MMTKIAGVRGIECEKDRDGMRCTVSAKSGKRGFPDVSSVSIVNANTVVVNGDPSYISLMPRGRANCSVSETKRGTRIRCV